jgi:hypothetical protein
MRFRFGDSPRSSAPLAAAAGDLAQWPHAGAAEFKRYSYFLCFRHKGR